MWPVVSYILKSLSNFFLLQKHYLRLLHWINLLFIFAIRKARALSLNFLNSASFFECYLQYSVLQLMSVEEDPWMQFRRFTVSWRHEDSLFGENLQACLVILCFVLQYVESPSATCHKWKCPLHWSLGGERGCCVFWTTAVSWSIHLDFCKTCCHQQ